MDRVAHRQRWLPGLAWGFMAARPAACAPLPLAYPSRRPDLVSSSSSWARLAASRAGWFSGSAIGLPSSPRASTSTASASASTRASSRRSPSSASAAGSDSGSVMNLRLPRPDAGSQSPSSPRRYSEVPSLTSHSADAPGLHGACKLVGPQRPSGLELSQGKATCQVPRRARLRSARYPSLTGYGLGVMAGPGDLLAGHLDLAEHLDHQAGAWRAAGWRPVRPRGPAWPGWRRMRAARSTAGWCCPTRPCRPGTPGRHQPGQQDRTADSQRPWAPPGTGPGAVSDRGPLNTRRSAGIATGSGCRSWPDKSPLLTGPGGNLPPGLRQPAARRR